MVLNPSLIVFSNKLTSTAADFLRNKIAVRNTICGLFLIQLAWRG